MDTDVIRLIGAAVTGASAINCCYPALISF